MVPEAHNPYFAAALEGIGNVLEDENLMLLLCNTRKDQEREEKILRMLNQQRLKGLIITPAADDTDAKETNRYKKCLEALNIPIIFMDSAVDLCQWDIVYFDNFMSSYNLVRGMLTNGCRDLGIMTGNLSTKTARDRYKGYTRALEEFENLTRM